MLVIAHRGASYDHPENTLEAFDAARSQGADWVELDVRLSADGGVRVLHDPVLPDGRVLAETPTIEISDDVPDLATALAVCRPLGVNVEIKHARDEPGFSEDRRIVGPVLDAIHLTPGGAPEVLVSSFDHGVLEALAAADPTVPRAWLVLKLDGVIERCAQAGHVAVHPADWLVDENFVAAAHDAGLAVNVWTVDDPARIVQLAAWGVDGVVTNRPALVRSVLDGRI